jgi:peptidyl-prolyl cis-trans isomerase SurA
MKRSLTALFVLISFSLSAQTLFYYGKDSVSANEFLKAYRKNNTGPKSETAFREYLDLYIASRLKIREAKERGYDTLPQMKADLQNLRQQILPAYLNDKEAVNKLVDEALVRSKKDIRLSHIFISAISGEDKARAALAELQQGNDFATVARKYSEDPSVKTNGGEIGWITVFDLPYELENLAYTTPAGKISTLHRSRAGFHIFKNEGERPDLGRMRISEILLAFPPGQGQEKTVKKLADSLYNRLIKGDDFAKLATKFSNDVVSANANGQVPEFGVGQYEPAFEQAVFALKKDVDISRPFLTSHGWHIVKRNSKKPVAWNAADKKSMEDLRNKVEQNDRISTTKTALANRILKNSDYRKNDFSQQELWAFTDSVINYKSPGRPLQVNSNTALFQLGDKKVTAADWVSFALTFRYKPDGSGVKPYSQLWDEFQEAMAID